MDMILSQGELEVLFSDNTDVLSVLRAKLEPLPPRQQLTQLIAFFQRHQEVTEKFNELVANAWAYLVDNNLWTTADYTSIDDFKNEIDYQVNIQPPNFSSFLLRDLLKSPETLRSLQSLESL